MLRPPEKVSLEELAEKCRKLTPISAMLLRWQKGSVDELKKIYDHAEARRDELQPPDELYKRFISTGVEGTMNGSLNDHPTIVGDKYPEESQDQSQWYVRGPRVDQRE